MVIQIQDWNCGRNDENRSSKKQGSVSHWLTHNWLLFYILIHELLLDLFTLLVCCQPFGWIDRSQEHFELKCVTGSLKVWAAQKPSRLFPTRTEVWLIIIVILIPVTKYNNASDQSLSSSLPFHVELFDIFVFCPWGSTISSVQMKKIAMLVKKMWFLNSCSLYFAVSCLTIRNSFKYDPLNPHSFVMIHLII